MLRKITRFYHYLPKPPSSNYDLKVMEHNPYAMLRRGGIVLDIGSKSAKGRYSFKNGLDAVKVIALDIVPCEGVDIAGDAHRLPVRSETIDCVVLVSVLMYIANPQHVIAEIMRVLRPGGLIYISTPFVFRYAPDPEDYFRSSVTGLQVLCQPFEEIQSGFNRGPASTMADLLSHFCAILFCFNSTRLYGLLVDFFTWCFFWIKYLDKWIADYSVAKVIHNGAFFFGRRPPTVK